MVAVNFAGEAISNEVNVTTGATPAAVVGAQMFYYDNQWWGSPTQNTAGYRSAGSAGGT